MIKIVVAEIIIIIIQNYKFVFLVFIHVNYLYNYIIINKKYFINNIKVKNVVQHHNVYQSLIVMNYYLELLHKLINVFNAHIHVKLVKVLIFALHVGNYL